MTMTPMALHRLSALALMLSVCLPMLAGCGSKPSVVGKWQTAASQPGASLQTVFDFMPDGKETMSFQRITEIGTLTFNGSGTYTVTGSTLTQNITSLTTGGKPVRLPSGTINSKTSAFTLDGDNLTLTDPDSKKSVTFTRVHE